MLILNANSLVEAAGVGGGGGNSVCQKLCSESE